MQLTYLPVSPGTGKKELRKKRWKHVGILLMLLLIVSLTHAQTVSMSYRNVPLEKIFRDIYRQTGYEFIYNTQMLQRAGKVSVQVSNMPLKSALDSCFKNQPLTYYFQDKVIVVKELPKATPLPHETEVLQSCRGKVINENGLPVEGAAVRVKGTSIGTYTNKEGVFVLSVKDPEVTLICSFLGYGTRELKTAAGSNIRITMAPTEGAVKEVVVTGIYNRSKESFTGSSATYSGQQLKTVGNQNILQSLKSLDPSMVILENNNFGSDPNHLPDIEIRGKSSAPGLKETFGTDPNQPLFILDGFPTSLQSVMDLDMNLVESVTILKDAASTAIYGARAANGVVVIETRKPIPGKLRVSYSGDFNLQLPDLHDYNLMNAAEKLEFERLAGRYSGNAGGAQFALEEQYNRKLADVQRGVNTYWLSEPVQTGFSPSNSLYVEGGDEQMRYGVGLNYKKINGVMKGSGRELGSANIDLLYRKNKLSFSNKLLINFAKATESPYGSFSNFANANPYYRKTDDAGNYPRYLESIPTNITDDQGVALFTNVPNPLYNAMLNGKNETSTQTLTNSFMVEWQLSPDLRARGRLGLIREMNNNVVFVSPKNTQFDPVDVLKKGSYTEGNSSRFQYESDASLTYGRLFGGMHQINAVAGYNMNGNTNRSSSFQAVGFPDDKIMTPLFAASYPENSKPGYSTQEQRAVSVYLNGNYGYKMRYLLDVNFRKDGSSVFGTNQRFTNSWSTGIAWNLHNESFFRHQHLFSMLKLRASIGTPGNQNFAAYTSLYTYAYNTNLQNVFGLGSSITKIGNPDLQWQKTLDKNIGADITMLNKKLTANIDIYQRITDPLVIVATTPASLGYSSYLTNFGGQVNNGFNVKVGYSPIYKPEQRIVWNVAVTARRDIGKYRNLGNKLDAWNKQNISKTFTRYYDGASVTAMWAVPSKGIDPSTGQEVLQKKNGEYTFTYSSDDEVNVGDERPKLEGVISNSFNYKGFNFSFFVRYRTGGDVFNTALYNKVENISRLGLNQNQDKRALYDRWKNPGDISRFKAISLITTSQITSRFVQEENTLAGESFSAGYDFMVSNAMRRAGLSSLRLNAYMNDIFRISSIKRERGIDYPFSRSVSFSLRATF